MQLLVEGSDHIETLSEDTNGVKHHYITGVFMQAEETNRNGRVYPISILEKETTRYIQDMVTNKRALGELNHSDTPAINLDRASHLVTELKIDGNHVYGKARVLDTPCGNIVRGLIDGGVKFGVSSRGIGSLTQQENFSVVGEDFQLAAIDVVYDPSAPKAFVETVMESKDLNWLMNDKTKDFLKSQYQEMNLYSMLVEMKAEILNLKGNHQNVLKENAELREAQLSIIKDNKYLQDVVLKYADAKIQRKEKRIAQLVESTQEKIDKLYQTKTSKSKDVLDQFEKFVNEISKR